MLVIGLDPFRVPGPWDPQPVADGIEAGRARFVEQDVAARFCLVGLDGSDDVEAVVTADLLAGVWECVVIGGGIRGENLGRAELQPPQQRIHVEEGLQRNCRRAFHQQTAPSARFQAGVAPRRTVAAPKRGRAGPGSCIGLADPGPPERRASRKAR